LSLRVERVLTRSAAVRTASAVIGETGSAIDRPGLREAARGTSCLDAAVIGGAAGGTEDCGPDFTRNGEAGIKKNDLKPWQKKEWCLGQIGGEFLARMEDVLDLYEESYDPKRPVVCFDEKTCQLLEDMVEPVAMKPGAVRKEDYHYRRKGTANVLMACEPLAGERLTQTTEQRTAQDYAFFIKDLARKYPEAHVIRLVQDNLNTHGPGSFYETFDAQTARELSMRFEFHYTPKKASWLNMAEIELGVLGKQCLHRRIKDQQTLQKQVRCWEKARNKMKAKIRWRFTTDIARDKMKRYYDTMVNYVD
jgi:hypothetical protein